MAKKKHSKEIYLFAGPNGSGKSTIIEDFLKNKDCPPYYICPDNLVDKRFKNDVDKYREAMDKAEVMRENALLENKSFTFESVLSTEGKIDFLKKAKLQGYHITTVFVTTNSSDINIERVKKRVSEGGHGVPTDKIVSRYKRSMTLLAKAYNVSDDFYVMDNSGDVAVSVFEHIDDYYGLNYDYQDLHWVKKYIIEPCGLYSKINTVF